MRRNTRTIAILLTLAALASIVALVLYALRQNINLFYTPSEIQNAKLGSKARVRLGGMVKSGSLKQAADLSLSFVITDFKQETVVQYTGLLPDLFREGQGVVALGKLLEDKTFAAEQILAKHDENYMPPELKHAA